MKREVVFRKSAEKSLFKLPHHTAGRILNKIQKLEQNPYPKGCVKLSNRSEFRIRVGVYRVLYTVSEKEVVIEAVDHRKDAYR